jgi:hypothetical protein
MTAKLYKKPNSTNILNSTASLSYNFNNINSFSNTTNVNRFVTINNIFEGYTDYINGTNVPITLKTLAVQSTNTINNNVSYYESSINSIIYYRLQYIHVGISPIKLNRGDDKYAWCIMLDLISSLSDKLLIIIPIFYNTTVTSTTEINDFSILIYNCNTTLDLKPFNINNFIKSNTFEIGGVSSSKFIILGGVINTKFFNTTTTPATLFTYDYTNINYKNTIYNSYANYSNTLSISQKTPSLIQNILPNDIYIDCQAVNTTDKSITNIPITQQNTTNENSDTSVAVFGFILAFIILYALYRLIKMITCKSKFVATPITSSP